MKNECHSKYRGVLPPVVMPFNEDESIDFDLLELFISWLCTQETGMLYPMGGSSEYLTLKVDERKKIMDIAMTASQGRKFVMAGVGAEKLEDVLELAKYADKNNVDGIHVVMPDNIEGTEDAIFNYYKQIFDVTRCPVMMYDPRGEGPHAATPSLMRRLLDAVGDRLVAIKYRTVDGVRMADMTRAVGEEISIFSGAETVYLQDLCLGAVGCVGGGGNFYPNLMNELQVKFEQGDIVGARQIQFQLLDACYALAPVYWPMSAKIILQELGFPFKLITRVKGPRFTEEGVNSIRVYYRRLLGL